MRVPLMQVGEGAIFSSGNISPFTSSVNLLKKEGYNRTLRHSPSSYYQNNQSGHAIVLPSQIGYNQSSNPNLSVAGITGHFTNAPTLAGLI